MILSFSKTLDEYLSGTKTVTRRSWKASHMKTWQKQFDKGNYIHQAWSALPFIEGAYELHSFKLTCRPYWEQLADMPASDLIAEGGMCQTLDEFYELIGMTPDETVAVVRFNVLISNSDAAQTFRSGTETAK
jgi:hypothetical protein